jgi:hypothetical protein
MVILLMLLYLLLLYLLLLQHIRRPAKSTSFRVANCQAWAILRVRARA